MQNLVSYWLNVGDEINSYSNWILIARQRGLLNFAFKGYVVDHLQFYKLNLGIQFGGICYCCPDLGYEMMNTVELISGANSCLNADKYKW